MRAALLVLPFALAVIRESLAYIDYGPFNPTADELMDQEHRQSKIKTNDKTKKKKIEKSTKA